MISNIIKSSDLFHKNVWSVQFFLPQKDFQIKDDYQLVKVGDLVYERKESIALTADDFDVNYVGLENIEAKTGRIVSFVPKHGAEIKSTCKRFDAGDILYGRLRPNLNKVYYNDIFSEGVCTTEIIVLTPNLDKVDPVYLTELLRTELINQRIVGLIKGAALPRVSMADLAQLAIPIPSLEKQHKLAAEIARRRAELDEHIRIAKQIPAEIDTFITAAFCM